VLGKPGSQFGRRGPDLSFGLAYYDYGGGHGLASTKSFQTAGAHATAEDFSQAVRIYELWDKYVRERDLEGLMSLYAEDATIQTPLVPAFFGPEKGPR
jgi:hypothetical protein